MCNSLQECVVISELYVFLYFPFEFQHLLE